jgi:ketosteroid isomerase-like protein
VSQTADNRRLVEAIFADLARGDARRFVDSMADTFSWTIGGTTRWSRTYEGKAAVTGELFGALQARIDGRIRTIADRIFADGDRVIVEAHGDNVTAKGERYDNRYCFVFRVDEGRLQSVTEYLDTALVERVLGHPDEAAV